MYYFLFQFGPVPEKPPQQKDDVVIYGSMAYLNDYNVEKYLSKGQHFVMFYAPWCKASQVYTYNHL